MTVMKPCKHCSSSGICIGMPIYNTPSCTGGSSVHEIPYYPCKYCNGKGWIDEEEVISVPRKFVKDEYFEDK